MKVHVESISGIELVTFEFNSTILFLEAHTRPRLCSIYWLSIVSASEFINICNDNISPSLDAKVTAMTRDDDDLRSYTLSESTVMVQRGREDFDRSAECVRVETDTTVFAWQPLLVRPSFKSIADRYVGFMQSAYEEKLSEQLVSETAYRPEEIISQFNVVDFFARRYERNTQ